MHRYLYSAMYKYTDEVAVCDWTPWLHPTSEYLCLSFLDWPTSMLSPTHDSSPTCYLMKTHFSFPLFWRNMSTWLSAVTIFKDPTHSYNTFTSYVVSTIYCNCVSLSLLWQHQIMYSYNCWYALIACGLRGRFVVQFTATMRPTKVQEITLDLPHWQTKTLKTSCKENPFLRRPWRETTGD